VTSPIPDDLRPHLRECLAFGPTCDPDSAAAVRRFARQAFRGQDVPTCPRELAAKIEACGEWMGRKGKGTLPRPRQNDGIAVRLVRLGPED